MVQLESGTVLFAMAPVLFAMAPVVFAMASRMTTSPPLAIVSAYDGLCLSQTLPLRFADALIRRWRLQFKTDAMKVVKRDGLQIKTLLRRFRTDPDVVRAAVEQNG